MSAEGRSTQDWQTETFQDFVPLDSQDDLFNQSNAFYNNNCEFNFTTSVYEYENTDLPNSSMAENTRNFTSLSPPTSSQSHIRYTTQSLSPSLHNDIVRGSGTTESISTQPYDPLHPSSPPTLTSQESSLHPSPEDELSSYTSSGEFRTTFYNSPSADFATINSEQLLRLNESEDHLDAGVHSLSGVVKAPSYFNNLSPSTGSSPPPIISLPVIEETHPPERNPEPVINRRRSQRIRGQTVRRGGQDRRRPYQKRTYSTPSERGRKKRNANSENSEAKKDKTKSNSRDKIEHENLEKIAYRGETPPDSRSPSVPVQSPINNEVNDWRQAYIEIIEQPQPKALRFRYICEGRSAGSIPGVRSRAESKTYPTVKVFNFKGSGYVKVSCVTKEPPYYPHPHNLVGKEGCKDGICTVKLNESMECVFPNLGIQCVKRKDVDEALNKKQKYKIDPFGTGYGHKSQIPNIDLNSVRLCFQAFIEDSKTGKTEALKPVVSDAIYDKKATSDLIICKLSDCSSSVAGGKEIILLCEKVAREDIQVRFFEIKNGQLHWESLGEFQTSDVHKQVAICLRTPKYKHLDIKCPVEVKIELLRPSDKSTSDPRPFQYIPYESDRQYVRRKMSKKATNRSLEHLMNTYLTSVRTSDDDGTDEMKLPPLLERPSSDTEEHSPSLAEEQVIFHPEDIPLVQRRPDNHEQTDEADTDSFERRALTHQTDIDIGAPVLRIHGHTSTLQNELQRKKSFTQEDGDGNQDDQYNQQKSLIDNERLRNESQNLTESEFTKRAYNRLYNSPESDSSRKAYTRHEDVPGLPQRRYYTTQQNEVSPPLQPQRKYSHIQELLESEPPRRRSYVSQELINSQRRSYNENKLPPMPELQRRTYVENDRVSEFESQRRHPSPIDGSLSNDRRQYTPEGGRLEAALQRRQHNQYEIHSTTEIPRRYIQQTVLNSNQKRPFAQDNTSNAEPHRRVYSHGQNQLISGSQRRICIYEEENFGTRQLYYNEKPASVVYTTVPVSEGSRVEFNSGHLNQEIRSYEEIATRLNDPTAEGYFEIATSHLPRQNATDKYASQVIMDLDTHRRINTVNYGDALLNSGELPSLSHSSYNDSQNNHKESSKTLRDPPPLLDTQNSYDTLEDNFLMSEEIVGFIQAEV